MSLEELEKSIKEIIQLVEKLDEKYRQKCFEILLNFHLRHELGLMTESEVVEKEKLPSEKDEFVIPIDVRAFLQSNNILEESLQKLFLMHRNEIRPIYKITATKRAAAQVQIALLTALENALHGSGSKFEFSTEAVRQVCKDHKVYDSANFKKIFKDNEKYFKSLDDEEHIELSPEGKTELAEVISLVTTK